MAIPICNGDWEMQLSFLMAKSQGCFLCICFTKREEKNTYQGILVSVTLRYYRFSAIMLPLLNALKIVFRAHRKLFSVFQMSLHPVEMDLIFETWSLRTTVMSKVGDKAENYHPIRKIYGLLPLDIMDHSEYYDHPCRN